MLEAAGLLRGYMWTSHWSTRNVLGELGASPVNARVVKDRNRVTGGGVTAGIGFGLHLAARLRNQKMAQGLQLMFEYNPPPIPWRNARKRPG